MPGRAHGCCAWPMVPTRFIARPSRSRNCANISPTRTASAMASDGSQGEEALPEPIAVREAHRFDTARLQGLLAQGLGARLAELRQMRGGQSNPTFLVVTDQAEYVLRKQPPGKLLPSAHAVDREFRVLSALAKTDVPVPRPVLFCDDREGIGTPFYLMERLKGRIFWSPALPGLAREVRRPISPTTASATTSRRITIRGCSATTSMRWASRAKMNMSVPIASAPAARTASPNSTLPSRSSASPSFWKVSWRGRRPATPRAARPSRRDRAAAHFPTAVGNWHAHNAPVFVMLFAN